MSLETALSLLEILTSSESEEFFEDGDFIFSIRCKPGLVPAAGSTGTSRVTDHAVDQAQLPRGFNLAH